MKSLQRKRMEPVARGEIVARWRDDLSLQRNRSVMPGAFARSASCLSYREQCVCVCAVTTSGRWLLVSGQLKILGGIRPCTARWRNGSLRPVLKHGPRSLAHVQVLGWQACVRNEGDCRDALHQQPTDQLGEVLVRACVLGPERW